MREVASKAATGESTAGLLKIMDQIAGLSAPRSLPPIAAGGYRVLEVRRDRPRPSRAAALAPLTGKPMRMRGFLTALFAGGLGLAVLAGPATCPTCDPAHADAQLDAKRILSLLAGNCLDHQHKEMFPSLLPISIAHSRAVDNWPRDWIDDVAGSRLSGA